MKANIISASIWGLLLLAGVAAYVYAERPIALPIVENPAPNGSASGTMPSGSGKESPTSSTLRGTITCLPHKGDGPYTMECAIGLKADDGKYYALTMFNYPDQADVGERVELIGAMVTTDELHSKYDIVGTFQVDTVTKI